MSDTEGIDIEEAELLEEFLIEFSDAQNEDHFEVEVDDLYAAFELWKSSKVGHGIRPTQGTALDPRKARH